MPSLLPFHVSTNNNNRLIGQILKEAGLIAQPQLDLSLANQKMDCYRDLMLGEILALRGWVPQQTSNFFACNWHKILAEAKKNKNMIRIERCLYQAGIINREQVLDILAKQNKGKDNFLELLLEHGYVRQKTLDYFIDNLCFENQLKYNLKHLMSTKRYDSVRDSGCQNQVLRHTLVLQY